MSDRDERAARLAEQLRLNLRRRKAQARAGQDADAAPCPPVSPPPLDDPA
ncbi:hypothetical protein [Sphingomonas sp. BK345]|nr:hypothetical protein [Sphingomonas sp. BK345]MBB3475038.1 hypothetical protein [Sphingomonas sp. BK345]